MDSFYNRCVIKLFDIDEELIYDVAGKYTDKDLTVNITTLHKDVKVVIANYSENDIAFSNLVNKINKKFANYIYADKDISLEQCLVDTMLESGKMFSVAESLTGGSLASKIIGISGASNVFYEGIVSYSSVSKVRRLHVPLSVIESKGAINEETARAMAHGLLEIKDIDYAVATTGAAGPLTDEFGTPVGRVYIGYGDRKYIEVKELNLTGDRNEIRECVVNYALFFMLRYVKKYN